MKEFIATYKDSQQIAIDDWNVFHPTLKVTEETTVGEILKWYKGGVRMEVTLIELESVPAKDLSLVELIDHMNGMNPDFPKL